MSYDYEIIKKVGLLSGDPEGFRKEVNIISWGGKEPGLDIRRWQPNGRPGKGVCMGRDEVEALRELLEEVTL